jgi:dUTP pyrophosphatase
MAQTVRIHRLRPHVQLPAYQTQGAAGFDLAAAEACTIDPGAVALIPTGLVIAVPDGFFLGVFARSSTPLRRGLMVANGVGIVDADYCGATDEIQIEVYNFTERPVTLEAGDRLAQAVLMPYARAEWVEVEAAGAPVRGGFGSTGAR